MNKNWIYDRFYLLPEMERLQAESISIHIDSLLQTMEKCRKHLWPAQPMQYDIHFDEMHGWANDGWIIAQCEGPQAEANAALIVEAVNMHDIALSALAYVDTGDDAALKAAVAGYRKGQG